MYEMDSVAADLALQAILGRGADFVGGIDNEALDFSQLEDFINSEGSQGCNSTYFGESLNNAVAAAAATASSTSTQIVAATAVAAATVVTGGKLLNVIVENNNKRNNNNNNQSGHSLPESPPDSSSEHPYSPQEGCCGGEQHAPSLPPPPPPPSSSSIIINQSDNNIYTTLNDQQQQSIYKSSSLHQQNIINPPSLLNDNDNNLMLNSHHIIVNNNNNNDNAVIIADTNNILTSRLIQQQHDSSLLNDTTRLILSSSISSDDDNNRSLLLSSSTLSSTLSNDNNSSFYNNNNDNDIITTYNNHQHHHQSSSLPVLDDIHQHHHQQQQQQTVYTNLSNVVVSSTKKRKLSQDSSLLVKSEPEHCTTSQLSPPEQSLSSSASAAASSIDEEYASSEACLSESQYQCIRFNPFQQNQWHSLCDQNLTEMPMPHYRVDADKGFNFSNSDDAFVCQKKNHFQITCHVQLLGEAQFVKTSDGFQKIASFHLHFYGVKHDCPTQTIRVEQSQSDRSKKPFHPVLVELANSQVCKVTVGRLHFSETTSNNMRKKGKPNPEQRYFQLVVGLHAHTTNGNFPVISHASQKIIVRASNPGQFESDVELCWQKGQTQDSIYHNGKVGINMDRPDESLVVHGNIKVTGHIIQPSDIRAKKNIVECDPAEQLRNVQKLRVVRYDYEPTFASQLSRTTRQYSDTGVIAQEVAEVLPEAVRPAGDLILDNGTSIANFLVVNKERIFMENIGAVKELCRVTDNLETRIDQLERINRRINNLKRVDSLKSNNASIKQQHHSIAAKEFYTKKKINNNNNYDDDDENNELCSNKFIQIVIVVLVLIMAFCLAAITTLYLMEASRHNQLAQNLQQVEGGGSSGGTHHSIITTSKQQNLINKKSTKNLSSNDANNNNGYWHTTMSPLEQQFHNQANKFDRNSKDLTKISLLDASLVKRPSFIIGRPSDCLSIEQDLENTNLCQIYCCASSSSSGPSSPLIHRPPSDTDQKKTSLIVAAVINSTQTTTRNDNNDDNIDKVTKPFHTNDIHIDKQHRQKRESSSSSDNNHNDDDDDVDDDDSFDSLIIDDRMNMFTIIIQGRGFNTTLTQKYLLTPYLTNLNNYSYTVPISKYMPDDFIKLIFRRVVTTMPQQQGTTNINNNIKEIEYCYHDDNNNHHRNEQRKCFYSNNNNNKGINYYDHKINENSPSQLISNNLIDSIVFKVDMVDFQSKLMTYRASIRQNQNTCKLSSTKLGLEFIEYNFHFYRHCDE